MFTEPRLAVYLDAFVPSIIIALHHNLAYTMANTDGKENIADGLITNLKPKSAATSPLKSSRKARSKSIGPGGLGELEAPALKETSGNRRKSAFIPAVKSILASNDEDEKKRRDARRKSLGTSRGNQGLRDY
jgi:kinetochore protein Spc7/SPC105